MISLHELDPLFFPLDDDPMIMIKSMNFPTSQSSTFLLHEVCSPPRFSLGKMSSYDLVSLISNFSEDDHSYLLILKQFKDGSHMHVGGLFEVNLSDNLEHPMIIYLGEILTKSKRTLAMSILIKY